MTPEAEAESIVPQVLLRTAVIGYVLLLWLAVQPFPQLPLLGSAQRKAERLLGFASVRAGISVFVGNVAEFAPHHTCVEVRGQTPDGWRTFYAPECPPRGTRWRMDALERVILRMGVAPKQPLLRKPIPPPSRAPLVVQTQIELGDYFCRQRPGFERIQIERVLHVRHMRDGSAPFAGQILVCEHECSEHYSPPDCTMRRSERFRNSLL